MDTNKVNKRKHIAHQHQHPSGNSTSDTHLSIVVDHRPPSTSGVSVRHSLGHPILILDNLLLGLDGPPPARTVSGVPSSGSRVAATLLRRLNIRLLLRRLRLAHLLRNSLARVLLDDNLLRLTILLPRRTVVKLLDHVAFSLNRAPFRGFGLGILGLHRLTIAIDVDDLPDHTATVSDDDLGPVAILDVFAGDVAWLADRWRRRIAFLWWWQSRVNRPDDLAARVLVGDLQDVALQVLVSDLALDAYLVVGWFCRVAGLLGSFVGDLVADGPRGALTDDLLFVVIILRRYLDHCSALLVRHFRREALAESDVGHFDNLLWLGSNGWVGETITGKGQEHEQQFARS